MAALDTNREREDEVYFTAAGMVDPDERAAFLDEACGENSALRQVVEEMLVSQDDADQLIARASSSFATSVAEIESAAGVNGIANTLADNMVGTTIDRYKVLQCLGEGGCGAVYLAEQLSPVRRRVALKIIKLGMDTHSVIARFETERQMLAMMEHPNIARVLDAGATETGRPYFVMELVAGTKITDYCDQNKLSVPERLSLFVQVCRAVQHAHQKGIIHRDLKPSNILVTLQDGKPVPKVIDFGVAKAIQSNLLEQSGVATSNGQLIGTPAYMSPEQAALRGVDVDTRSDIYSLGTLLYELLTGQTPFDSKQLLSAGVDRMRRTLTLTEPRRPAAALSWLKLADSDRTAERRRTTVPDLISSISGDLDSIVMKALEKDPARRYETANGFYRDIERHLNHEPVAARPQTRLYRFQKTVRRNRLVFAAGTAATLALAIGLGTTVWMLFRERELRQRAVAAEQEQARLREIAERGLADEAELRRQSEARQAILQAAALINQQEFINADALMAKVPLENPTLEGVEVFRALGDWNAVTGNWKAARDRFYQLRHANRIQHTESISLDITRAAVAYIECDDTKGYEQFRLRIIQTFADTSDPMVAERVVKNCLLRPASDSLIRALEPFAELVRKSVSGRDFAEPEGDWWPGWRCLSLALLDFRSGNWADAIVWSQRCVRFEGPRSRPAAGQSVLAMALFRSGQVAEARDVLAKARDTITTRFSTQLQPWESGQYWFDWVLAEILLREAESVVGQ